MNNTGLKHSRSDLIEKIKTANKIMGRQGDQIHLLRAELAQVRSESSKIDRGELRRLEHNNMLLKMELNAALDKLAELNKATESQKPELTLVDN